MNDARDHTRIQPFDPKHATGKTKRLLGQVRAKLGLAPNLLRVLANARPSRSKVV